MAEVTIVGFPASTYVRTARLALEEKGVSYEMDESVKLRSDELRALHPFGKVPVLRHGDLTLFETSAIVRYVDDAFDGPALQPADPRGRAEMEKWISIYNAYIDPTVIRTIVFERVLAPRFGREPDEEKIGKAMPEAQRQISLVEAELGGRDFLAGDTVSMADFFMLPGLYYFYQTPEGGALMAESEAPRLGKWFERMASRPSYGATRPPKPE